MAEAFQRERAHHTRGYEKWHESGEKMDPRQGVRDDWSWTKSDWDAWKTAEQNRFQTFQRPSRSPIAHHLRALGLDEYYFLAFFLIFVISGCKCSYFYSEFYFAGQKLVHIHRLT